ncbi:response regulator [Actinoplanes regularis]|uniref:Two component transcriptional regulator, LuxR family n=1 Tax=Actinoplanes regularis TaxID=52697 RepID=A0A239CP92_9ACTN|nr:response regulator transcription factor [Actinoplanes regularis]GIE88646.1 DNA-binding response regulator [Actinoplanes regularis]SNS21975.1 two component transcriptional regulator, LuxR family [Actinoplanes regularis]
MAGVTGRPVRVAVVDDDPLVRSGLRLLFAGRPDLEVVAEGADGTEVAGIVDAHHPDVVLLDVRMPRVDGLEAAERLCARPRPPYVVMLTTFHADAYVLRALRAGASGYLLKDAPPRELIDAIRRVAAGEPILSPAVTRRLIEQVADPVSHDRRVAARARLERATDREREVAAAVARGLSNAQIADELGMGVPTVKAHVSRLLTKLDLDNRVQIALLVHDASLLS